MIDISKLKELVALMAEHDLAEVDIKNGEEAITIKRGMGSAPVVQPTSSRLRARISTSSRSRGAAR